MGTVERFSTTLQTGADAGPAILAALEVAERFAVQAALTPAAAARLRIVVEELVSNVLRHGGASSEIALDLVLSTAQGHVQLALADDGPAFNPNAERQFEGPDRERGGGVGLALIRSWAQQIHYTRDGEFNRIRLTLPAA
jgi:anti-sigma regulatory factor (Ser/Thr protein kinase)